MSSMYVQRWYQDAALVLVQDLDADDIMRDARMAVMDAKADITSEMV